MSKTLPAGVKKKHIFLALALGSCLWLFWFALGCYGLYAIVYPTVQYVPPPGERNHPEEITLQCVPPPGERNHPEEIVIRVIREIVHVDSGGIYVDSGTEDTRMTAQQKEQIIAQCIVNAVN
jgi:hypothetical protein